MVSVRVLVPAFLSSDREGSDAFFPLVPKFYLGTGLGAKLCFAFPPVNPVHIPRGSRHEAELRGHLRSQVKRGNEENGIAAQGSSGAGDGAEGGRGLGPPFRHFMGQIKFFQWSFPPGFPPGAQWNQLAWFLSDWTCRRSS